MTPLSIHALTARSVTVLIHAAVARYHLDSPVAWSLNDGEQRGETRHVPVFLEGLRPETDYTFHAAGSEVAFRTLPCAGLVNAADFGVSEGAGDNADAFADAITAMPHGGTLMVPQGRFMTRPVFLKSDMTFYLPAGADIIALADRSDWPILPSHDHTGRVIGTWEGLPDTCYAAPLTAIGCDRLMITGAGAIDGGGSRGDWWTWPKDTRNGSRRARALFMAHCRDVLLSGFSLRNSPSWTVHPFQCHGLVAAALHIENPADSPNTDGFNPESCTNLELRGLRISVGDDCIAIKAGKRGTGADTRVDHIAPTRNLRIENCLMQDGHGAVVIGSEMSGDVTDVDIARCEFVGTDRGLRIKTRRGRGGQVARISLRDVLMDGVGTGIAVNAFYFCDADGKSHAVQSRDPAPPDCTTPHITGITIEDIELRRLRHAAAAILGLPEAPVTQVHLSRITLDFDPQAEAGETLMACHLPPIRHGGILHRFAQIDADTALIGMLKEFQDVG